MENQYPLDFDTLTKPQLLSVEYLESVFGVKYVQGQRWSLLLMGLQSQIHDKTDLTCKVERDAIRILTDAEASEHNYQRVAGHVRGIGRRTEKLLQVDRAKLDAGESVSHDQRIFAATKFVGAITSARSEIQGVGPTPMPKRLTTVTEAQ